VASTPGVELYTRDMPNRSSKPKRPRDFNSLAHQVVAELTGTTPAPDDMQEDDLLRAAAAALGRRGGLKGGQARAERLSSERRSEIARAAAQARWRKDKAEE
jgi:hypothetical protein